MAPWRAHATGAAALAVALAVAVPAAAVQQTARDSAGRVITFDVQAPGADVPGYAGILDGLLHGAEISQVVVTIVPETAIATTCGAGAAACYRYSSREGATIFVPSLPPDRVRGSLAHEYGHHVDATRPHLAGARGLDGTPSWWASRGMGGLLAGGSVAWDYSLGWDRSIAEVFAEDYTLANGARATSSIRWLGNPTPAVVDAIRADLVGPAAPAGTPGPGSVAPAPPPAGAGGAAGARRRVVAKGSGRLAAGRRARIDFALTAPRAVWVRVSGASGGRVRAVLRCGRRALGGAAALPGRRAVVRATRVGPGRCRVTLRAVGGASRFRAVVSTGAPGARAAEAPGAGRAREISG